MTPLGRPTSSPLEWYVCAYGNSLWKGQYASRKEALKDGSTRLGAPPDLCICNPMTLPPVRTAADIADEDTAVSAAPSGVRVSGCAAGCTAGRGHRGGCLVPGGVVG